MPDFSQYCQAKYCYEYRILLVEQLKERQEAYRWQFAQHLLMEGFRVQQRINAHEDIPYLRDSDSPEESDSD